MPVNYANKIVTDSLAAYWDPGTLKCYDPRENLFLRSNEFGTSPWSIDLGGGYDVFTGAVGAPDGTLTGVRLYNKSAANNFNFFNQQVTTSNNGIYTYSIYIKKFDFATVTILCGINNMTYANSFVYNFDTDTISFPFGITPGLFINTQVIDAPNGWKRAILTFDASAFGQTVTNVGGGAYVGTAGNTGAANTKSAYFWGAQLERNLSPSTYSVTTTSQYTKSTTLTDLTGNANNLTATNFPLWSSNNGGYFRLPTSGYFTGTGNNTLPVKNADYTLQGWVRYPTTTVINGGGILSVGTHSSTVGLYNSIRNLANFGSFSHWWFGNNLDVSTNTAGIVANQWYMITGTYTQGIRRLYVNSTQIATDVPTENHDVPFNPTIEIGRAANNTLGAEIGPCAVYRTGLSATQISRNYQALRARFNA